MSFQEKMSDDRMLEKIGGRLAALRLAKDLTQGQLAKEAGIGLRTLQRLEAGEVATRLSGFVGVCRVLGLASRFEMLLPKVPVSPFDEMKLQGKKRERASGTKKPISDSFNEEPSNWKWGDEK